MKTLNVNIANLVATYSQRGGDIVCDNKSRYQIKFTFDADWSAYSTKTARFVHNGEYTDVDFTGDTVTVPMIHNTNSLKVGVYAGDLCTTTPAEIKCVLSISSLTDTPSTENDKNWANEAKEAAERAAEDARAEVTRLVGEIGVVQAKGTSPTAVMSQKATTDNIDAILSAFETEGGYNLLDPNNAESGYYANESGVLVEKSSSNHLRTVTPIPVVVGSNLHIKTNADSTQVMSILWLDESGAVVGQDSAKVSTAYSNVLIKGAPSKAKKAHFWVSGVSSEGLSFDNVCISSTEITEYEEYGATKTPTALKDAFLPDLSPLEEQILQKANERTDEEIAKQNIIPYNSVEKKPFFDGNKPLEFPNKGKRLADNGTLYDHTSCDTTDYIPIADTYQVYVTITNGVKYSLQGIAYYDADKSFIKGTYNGIGTNYEFTEIDGKPNSYAYPINEYPEAVYVRISTGNSFSAIEHTITPYMTEYSMDNALINMPTLEPLILRLAKPLRDKVIVNFGDSIFGNYRGSDSVSAVLANHTGATVYNCGFGGCRMASHSLANFDAFSMYNLANSIASGDYSLQDAAFNISAGENLPSYFSSTLATLKGVDFSTVDIITIAYGTNDFAGGKSLDNESDLYDTTKFAGALRHSIETILGKYPHIRIFVCSQIYRFWMDGNGAFTEDSDTKSSFSSAGDKLTDFVAKTKEVAEAYHLPFIDNYYELGMNKFNRTVYFTATDGTHPNATGRELLARHIAAKLF